MRSAEPTEVPPYFWTIRPTGSGGFYKQSGYDRGMAKLRHIALTVPDPEKAAKFYMEAFGLKRVGETDWAGASGVYLSDGVINIALLRYKSEEMAGHRGRGFVGVHHFGFIVEDVAAARRRSRPRGRRTGWASRTKAAASTK